MARRRSSSNRVENRDAFAIANRVDRLVLRPIVIVRRVPTLTVVRRSVSDPLFDRRGYHPLHQMRPLAVRGDRRARQVQPGSLSFYAREHLRFSVPERVRKCVQRQERKEVLHALQRTRSGRGRAKRRDYWSSIACRR